MSKNIINKTYVLAFGTIFADDIETPEIKLTNSQSAKVTISTNEGTASKTTAKVVAVLSDGTEQEIKTQSITIGDNAIETIDVVANEIAHYDAEGFKVKIDAISDCEIDGVIVLALDEARYSVEDDNPVVAVESEPVDEEIPTEKPAVENPEQPTEVN